MPLDQSVKPTPGGYEIQCGRRLGTLGATILWSPDGRNQRRVGISNAHVLQRVGSPICQPVTTDVKARFLGNVAGVAAAPLYKSEQDYFGDEGGRADARFDFAFFDALPAETSTRIEGIYSGPWGPIHRLTGYDPPPLQWRPPRLGEEVRWMGKSTGEVRSGKIVDLNYWGFIGRTDDPTMFCGISELLKIGELNGPSRAGDSGAALVASDQQIVGLYCGATSDEAFGIGSKIPADDLELGETTLVSQEVALQRHELYKVRPKEHLVVQ
ncbi:hypothetical protein [Actinacidiphila bryophytorum]|uniref:hypothetical protein n=1 Tax=Actinacidiphila bryophytorum TaxID=1436133 RepID=UPI002176B4D1|nr:hypothetical protein [Actinacidiphila bryophytorum]UWE12765.1 hypothetical protein NYE86_31485 [Actinacidiphila bryophytorum]